MYGFLDAGFINSFFVSTVSCSIKIIGNSFASELLYSLVVLHVWFLHACYGTRKIGIIFDAMGQVESTQEYARKRSDLLILKEEQKQQIKAKVKEILNKTHNEKIYTQNYHNNNYGN
ncbi:hypothetical protein P344_06115 [Spiroplasma mirum ATCC 29335]|uniref:Uncharacterized protein n=2 Tax=Spiroplasma mirum TaxID=2144 RepID=W0GS62_9MOLU|nr:hypothetical protein [Spiroplasma atrichopogonis]AHF61401.1 hypothetical protein SMM_1025 [Spiroplasma mirum ATCC 29335]AHI58530.1 hypothetical protein P344_06115 [Spiroplasma mirum ATCC 29335]